MLTSISPAPVTVWTLVETRCEDVAHDLRLPLGFVGARAHRLRSVPRLGAVICEQRSSMITAIAGLQAF
jgi:hypothetical protein